MYIPTAAGNVTGTMGGFPKALGYNLGYLVFSKTKFSMFHDSDIVVDLDYFSSFLDNIRNPNKPKWFFPYKVIANLLRKIEIDEKIVENS